MLVSSHLKELMFSFFFFFAIVWMRVLDFLLFLPLGLLLWGILCVMVWLCFWVFSEFQGC